MKKCVLFAVTMMTACSSIELPTESEEPTATEVTMTFSPYEVKAMTRASVADFATRLDIWLYEAGNEVQAYHQQSTDDDFGTLTATLDKTKTYTLYAVAHKCASPATFSNSVVSFPDEKVTHTMFCTQTFTPSATTTLSCEMPRIVGNFRMETSDQIPDEVKRVELSITDSPTRWNVAGYGVNPTSRTSTFSDFPRRSDGTVAFSIFIIADADEVTNYDIQVTAYDSSDDIIQSRTFTNVPVRNGYRTSYVGTFFIDQDVTATFTVADWNDFDTVNF